jgi:prepilin-type N-terminal cleavage/methylation domain-containing protein
MNWKEKGFTLVEIMIVTAIIGLLAMIAVPAFLRANWRARRARYAHDVRVAAAGFEIYAMENGDYPPDRTPGVIPPGMGGYLKKVRWTEETSLGGNWDWDYGVFGLTAGVSVKSPKADIDQLKLLDGEIDDGSLASGVFRMRSGGYIYILQE